MLMPANTSDPSPAATLGYVRRRLIAAILGALVAATAAASRERRPRCRPDLGRTIGQGGVLLVIRHAATDFSKPDQDPVELDALRDAAQPLRTGPRRGARDRPRRAAALGIRVGPVLASRFCRTRETARLAFSAARPSTPRSSTRSPPSTTRPGEARSADVRRLFGHEADAGDDHRRLVTHGVVVYGHHRPNARGR